MAQRQRRPPAVARVLRTVTASMRAAGMAERGDVVLAAISGGPDSCCLVESLVRLRRLLGIRVELFHLDHRLRDDSGADAAYVRRMGARLHLPVHVREAADGPPAGASVEAWARDRRRAAAEEVAAAVGASRIALGHTRDDQAETVLLHLLTGSGPAGLAGIAPVDGPWIRPLLDVTREEVEAFCRALRLRPRRDPTNRDPRFLRNALRLEGIPALERALGRSIRDPIVRTAAAQREDVRALEALAEAAEGALTRDIESGVEIDPAGLRALDPAIASRVAARAAYRCGLVPVRADIEAILDLATGRPGRRRDLTGGAEARRTRDRVRITGTG